MNRNLGLAMVALNEARLPEDEAVILTFHGASSQGSLLTELRRRCQAVTFRVGRITDVYPHIPQPIPWDQLEGPCATVWHWPQAATVMRGHQVHSLVTLLDETSDLVGKSTLLAQLLTAPAQVSASVGIYWGPGQLVHKVAPFVDQGRQMTREIFPLYLWIDF